VKDGFCTIHHPDTVRKRELAKEARFKAKMKQHLAPFERIEKLERELAAAESRLRELAKEGSELCAYETPSEDEVAAFRKRCRALLAAPTGEKT
jgi:predicted nuclease with TOPRIM domain